jgi:SGNH domain (fused to AT3 domains)
VAAMNRMFALSFALLAGMAGTGTVPAFRVTPGSSQHRHGPKPVPPGGDTKPWVVIGSSSARSAPTLGVVGDSVARDYAYYLAGELGRSGVRVVDGALSACPVGALPLLSRLHDVVKPLRDGGCPRLVVGKQQAMLKDYAPKVILWHSITELWSIADPKGEVPSGSPEWARRVRADWEATLTRLTRGDAKIVLVLPLWYERTAPARLDAPGPSVEKLRDLYIRWAAGHQDTVTLVDVAPLVCPAGPPCGVVNGIDYRPDSTHYDDPGGVRVAAYLRAHVPALAELAAGH